MQQTTGSSILPQIQARRQPLVNVARAQIGEAAWAAAWQKGRDMPLDRALALAGETVDQAATRDPGADDDLT